MSTFGDRTAQQSMLEWARVVASDHNLTDEEFSIGNSILKEVYDD